MFKTKKDAIIRVLKTIDSNADEIQQAFYNWQESDDIDELADGIQQGVFAIKELTEQLRNMAIKTIKEGALR